MRASRTSCCTTWATYCGPSPCPDLRGGRRATGVLPQPERVALDAQGKGELKGYRNALLRQVRVRFGEAVAGTLAALLEPVTNIGELDQINHWVATCESGEALLARLRRV